MGANCRAAESKPVLTSRTYYKILQVKWKNLLCWNLFHSAGRAHFTSTTRKGKSSQVSLLSRSRGVSWTVAIPTHAHLISSHLPNYHPHTWLDIIPTPSQFLSPHLPNYYPHTCLILSPHLANYYPHTCLDIIPTPAQSLTPALACHNPHPCPVSPILYIPLFSQ